MDLNELSFFSGAGGGLLGAKLLGWTTIGYVEYEKYCQKLLRQRIADGILDPAPIFGDIKKFISEGYAKAYQGMVDILTAGFPCPDFSVAGKREGAEGKRNMWPETWDCIRIIRPDQVLLENVPGLLTSELEADPNVFIRYFGSICGDLAEIGYDNIRYCILGADDVGAPHRRKRLWIVANSQTVRSGRGTVRGCGVQKRKLEQDEQTGHSVGSEAEGCRSGSGKTVANSGKPGLEGGECKSSQQTTMRTTERQGGRISWWDTDPADIPDTNKNRQSAVPLNDEQGKSLQGISETGANGPTEPRLGRVAHGVAYRVDRLKAIGNGQVPIVAATAWKILNGH